jgi:hypothetical protein
MDWQTISDISQLVSSIAVVLSVLYLGMQVHQSTRVARVAAQDSAAAALRDVTKVFMENAEPARIWRQGLTDLDALSGEEQARFFHAVHQFLKAYETIHYHHVHGVMDEQIWAGWLALLRHYAVAPGIARYWNLRRELFSRRFQELVESLPPPDTLLTVANLLEAEGQKKS